jgi:hypothetical protein
MALISRLKRWLDNRVAEFEQAMKEHNEWLAEHPEYIPPSQLYQGGVNGIRY